MQNKYIQFKINPAEEAENLPKIVKLAGIKILNPRIREIYKKSKKKLAFEITKLHKENKRKLIEIKAFYENLWKKIGKDYIKSIEKLMDFKIKDKKICHISPSLLVNIAEVKGRKNIFIAAEKAQYYPLDFILLHELAHLYYTDKICELNLPEAGKSPLMEGVDNLLLFKSPIKKLIKETNYNNLSFVQNNKKFMAELEKAWKNRINFESFIIEAVKIQSKLKKLAKWY